MGKSALLKRESLAVRALKDAWLKGQRTVADELNRVLPAGLRIEVDPGQPRTTLTVATERFWAAFSSVVTEFPDAVGNMTKSNTPLWTVGCINDVTNKPWLLGQYGNDPDADLADMVRFLKESYASWSELQWQTCIVDSVNAHKTGWITWFASLPAAGSASADGKPIYLGDGKVRIDGTTIALEVTEGEILEEILDRGGAASLKELSDDAPRVLKRIQKKYSELAPFIHIPGSRGKGGYRLSILEAREQV